MEISFIMTVNSDLLVVTDWNTEVRIMRLPQHQKSANSSYKKIIYNDYIVNILGFLGHIVFLHPINFAVIG